MSAAKQPRYYENVERNKAQALKSYHKNKNKEANQTRRVARREAHRAEACAASAKWRADHKDLLMTEASKEYHRKAIRKWQQSEKGKAARKKYVAAHPEEFYEYTKKWRSKNWERYMDGCRQNWDKHRAMELGAEITDFTTKEWKELKDLYLNSCAYCRRYCARLTRDHVIPLTKGGNHTMANIVPACKSCNSKKGNRLIMKPLDPPKEKEVIYG